MQRVFKRLPGIFPGPRLSPLVNEYSTLTGLNPMQATTLEVVESRVVLQVADRSGAGNGP